MVREVYNSVIDNLEVLLGKRDELTPPRRLVETIGGGNYNVIGEEFFRYFVEFGRLQPHHNVLDVGCGCGRMAVPLTGYLSEQAGYWGFDIMPESIAWCEKHIGARHRNFHFLLADIYNHAYNPQGRFQASEYWFPYLDNFFDLVFVTSVFTHMLADDMRHYVSQVSRVLKPGSRCLISFFLLNRDSRDLLQSGRSTIAFPYEKTDCRIASLDTPEGAVAFDEDLVREVLSQRGLEIEDPIRYGGWCGRRPRQSYQDLVLAVKR